MEEIWKEVPGFPGYEVSSLGQVRSYFYRSGGGRWEVAENPQRVLAPSNDTHYRGVGLMRNGKQHRRRVGRLVLLAFVGPPPDSMEMCHNDGDSTNDHLTNLRWDTHRGNMQDQLAHDTRRLPPQNKPALGQEEVRVIRGRFASGKHSPLELAREFGVSRAVIYRVLNGQGAYKGGAGPIRRPRHIQKVPGEDVIGIREMRASGVALEEIASRYSVSRSTVSRIARGERRADVGGPITAVRQRRDSGCFRHVDDRILQVMQVGMLNETGTVLEAVRLHWAEHGRSPTYEAIMTLTGIVSPIIVVHHLCRLEEERRLTWRRKGRPDAEIVALRKLGIP